MRIIKKIRNDGYNVRRDDIVAGIRYMNLVAGSSLIDVMNHYELIKTYYDTLVKNNIIRKA